MNKNKIRAAALALLLAGSATFGLVACSSDTNAAGSGDSSSSDTATAEVDVKADLETARQAVVDALADNPSWAQVMLAGDVKQPTEKYGMLVMPFVKSEAAKRVTGTVNISDGKYVIEAESAETGDTWQIDQDGNISQVTK